LGGVRVYSALDGDHDLRMGNLGAAVFMKFKPGDPVRKIKGGYQANGEIRAAFTNKAGDPRYVFEFADLPGMLHIFNENQLERGHDTALLSKLGGE